MAAKRGKKPTPPSGSHAKVKPQGARPAPGAGLVATLGKALLTLAVVAVVFLIVVAVGRRAGQQVADNPRYEVKFADIACDVPPGTDKQRFLTEVRYLGDLPETVQVVDPALKDRLAELFARHPWVAKVEPIVIGADRSVRVPLVFRVPVLAVNVGEAEPRTVDKLGVILPSLPNPAALPLLTTRQAPPKEPPGEVWGSDVVRRAADLASTYQPRPRQIEHTPKGWKLTRADGQVVTIGW